MKISKENYKMQKMVKTLILACGQNLGMSSTPYHYGHHLVLRANISPSHHKRNPCMSQPLVGDELPHL